ncbi:dihydrofolate reductase [Fibrobacterota bacterium]
MTVFDIIVAMDLNRGIGLNGSLPWHLKKDIQYFKTMTSAQDPFEVQREFGIISTDNSPQPVTKSNRGNSKNTIIMGRRTWDSIPESVRPLPDRHNLILSRHLDYSGAGFSTFPSLEAALEQTENMREGRIFVIGGANTFRQAITNYRCKYIYITEVMGKLECDVFFPDLPSWFRETACSEVYEEKYLKFRFKVLKRT